MPKVVVLGSINQDVVVTTAVLPTAGQTVVGSNVGYFAGGKGANQAVAASCSGVETTIIGRVGSDIAGSELIGFLKEKSVDTSHITIEGDLPTGAALIVVDSKGENTIVFAPGANLAVAVDPSVKINAGDVLLAQFEVPISSIVEFFKLGKANGATTVLNPSPALAVPEELKEDVDFCVLNETELSSLSGTEISPVTDVETMSRAARSLGFGPNSAVVVTLGKQGALLVNPDSSEFFEGHSVVAIDTTGAGDCFVGSMAACLTFQDTLDSALGYANRAAAICVTRPGAGPSMPRAEEVLAAGG